MFYALLAIAALMIIGEIFSAMANRRVRREGFGSEKWDTAHRWRWILGVPFVILSVFITYPMAGDTAGYTVVGFPLMVAAFDEAGHDYVGPFTAPSFLANALIWYFLPQIMLFIWARAPKPGGK